MSRLMANRHNSSIVKMEEQYSPKNSVLRKVGKDAIDSFGQSVVEAATTATNGLPLIGQVGLDHLGEKVEKTVEMATETVEKATEKLERIVMTAVVLFCWSIAIAMGEAVCDFVLLDLAAKAVIIFAMLKFLKWQFGYDAAGIT